MTLEEFADCECEAVADDLSDVALYPSIEITYYCECCDHIEVYVGC